MLKHRLQTWNISEATSRFWAVASTYVNAKNFLPKGSFMVNSTRVEAMVVFTGENSKMQINQEAHKWK